jgi:phosphoglycerate kinase
MSKKGIRDIDIKDKKVLMRVDFNVPLDDKGGIADDSRIRAVLPTIEYILEKGAGLIIMSHLGRPNGAIREELRMTPVGRRLEEMLHRPVKKLDSCIGPEVMEAVNEMSPGEVILLENLRFHKEETENDQEFARQLSMLGDLFVNDAFGTCHRSHASTEGVTHYLRSVAGLLVEKEIEYFEKINSAPERPFILVLGGAKVSDKIPVLENMLPKVNRILIGGGMAYTFLRQTGVNVGSSIYEKDVADVAGAVLEKAKTVGVELVLPVDHIICHNINSAEKIKTTKNAYIEDGFLGADIGPKTIELFREKLHNAKTIVWNGPMGVFEKDEFSRGTREIAEAIAESSAVSVVGGGDSAAAAMKYGIQDRISHISTGGGASLEYLEGKVLPGIAALEDK